MNRIARSSVAVLAGATGTAVAISTSAKIIAMVEDFKKIFLLIFRSKYKGPVVEQPGGSTCG